MASGATVKMGVDVSGFKKGMQEATNSVKTLDAQLKTNEKQLKATGDAEVYMSNKAGLLEKQLEEQQKVVKNANDALQAMKDKGISPASAEFQQMERNLAGAMGKMFDIKTELNQVQTNAGGATKETKGMNTELKNIGKGVAFQNVTSGLKTITDSLEKGARAAVNLGKKLVSSVRDSTGWADDILTRATQNGVDAETIQRMDNVARFIDTDVDTILAARGRLAKNNGKVEELFGLKTDGMSLEDQFWAVGEAISGMTDDVEREQAAQEIFGRGWKELIPLFAAGREEYSQLMEEQNVLTNEQVQKLGEADDQFQKMELEIQRLKNQFWAENSQTIIDLLQWVIDNKDGVVTAITAIGGAFGLLKMGQLALDIKKVIDGFNTLKGMGGGDKTPTLPKGTEAAAAGGKSWLASAGAWLSDALGMSLTGAGIGAALSGLIVYGGSKAIANLNDEANKAREVAYDANRFSAIGGPMGNKQLVLQDTVRRLLSTNGDAGGVNGPEYQLKWLAYNLNDQLIDAFKYTNTSGESRNKLLDMLNMDPQNAAVAAMIMHSAGIQTDDSRLSGADQGAYAEAWARYLEMNRPGGPQLGYSTALGTINDFFMKSGTYNENGEWSIPGLEDLTMKTGELDTAFSGLKDSVPVTDEQIIQLGTDTEEATGHVSKFGELAGGAEHDVSDLGGAAATAAAELASIKAPDFSFFWPFGGSHANGLPFVPTDNYMALLHRGKRVVPAREAAGSFSSNLYVESMYMNNGTDAEGLAAAMAAAQRRTMSGYGS